MTTPDAQVRLDAVIRDGVDALAEGRNDDVTTAIHWYARLAGVTREEAGDRIMGAFHAMTGGAFASPRRW